MSLVRPWYTREMHDGISLPRRLMTSRFRSARLLVAALSFPTPFDKIRTFSAFTNPGCWTRALEAAQDADDLTALSRKQTLLSAACMGGSPPHAETLAHSSERRL